MKKVFLLFAVLFVLSFASCTDNISDYEEQLQEIAIEPEKDCPENDRNCNGIPDDQE